MTEEVTSTTTVAANGKCVPCTTHIIPSLDFALPLETDESAEHPLLGMPRKVVGGLVEYLQGLLVDFGGLARETH